MKVVTIGRTDNNNIVINDSKVSRSHLQIILDDDGNYYAKDLDSTNGTFVNGKRISGKIQLQKGDAIEVCDVKLNWESYFSKESYKDTQIGSDTEKSNGKKKILFILFVLLLGICAGIGVYCAMPYINVNNTVPVIVSDTIVADEKNNVDSIIVSDSEYGVLEHKISELEDKIRELEQIVKNLEQIVRAEVKELKQENQKLEEVINEVANKINDKSATEEGNEILSNDSLRSKDTIFIEHKRTIYRDYGAAYWR